MESRRHEETNNKGELQRVSLDVSPDGFWTRHYVSCDIADTSRGAPYHTSPTVRINAASFSGRTAEQLREYASQMNELATIADELQAEMSERYKTWADARGDA